MGDKSDSIYPKGAEEDKYLLKQFDLWMLLNELNTGAADKRAIIKQFKHCVYKMLS
jgi:hypothetical protein